MNYNNMNTLKDIWNRECTVYWCTEDFDIWKAGVIKRLKLTTDVDYSQHTDEQIIEALKNSDNNTII